MLATAIWKLMSCPSGTTSPFFGVDHALLRNLVLRDDHTHWHAVARALENLLAVRQRHVRELRAIVDAAK